MGGIQQDCRCEVFRDMGKIQRSKVVERHKRADEKTQQKRQIPHTAGKMFITFNYIETVLLQSGNPLH